MLNINTEISLQVLDINDSPVGEPLVFSNAMTEYGMSLIDPLAEDPDFPSHYIHIGSGYLKENPNNDLEHRIARVAANVSVNVTQPDDPFAKPVLKTRTLSAIFPISITELSIREIGIGANRTGNNSMYTYTNIKTPDGMPHTLHLRSTEKLYVTYRYQILTPAYLPNNMIVSGGELPEGVIGCMYPVDLSSKRGYYYYDSMEDFTQSGWENVYTNMYVQNNPSLRFREDFGQSDFNHLENAGSSEGYLTLLSNNMIPITASQPDDSLGITPFTWKGDSFRYVVAVRLAPEYAIFFNKPVIINRNSVFSLTTSALFEAVETEYVDSEKYNA